MEGTMGMRSAGRPCSAAGLFRVALVGVVGLASCSVPDIGATAGGTEDEGAEAYLLEEGEENGASATTAAAEPTTPVVPIVETLDQRMAELSAPIGAQYSAANNFETFSMPSDVPIFGGNVTGTFTGAVMDDQGVIRESRIVGTDDVINIETLQAFNETVNGDEASGWAPEVLNEDPAVLTNVLLAEDGSGALFINRSFLEPLPQQASFQHEHIFGVDTMTLPEWLSALPFPGGGVMVSYREGIGRVVDRDQSGQNGYIEAQVHFPAESQALIEELYGGEALATAGFQRADPGFAIGTELLIAQGPWSGSVLAVPQAHLGVEGFVVRISLFQPAG